MSGCGPGFGSIDPAFADRVELELVHSELQGWMTLAPSREVLREEHRRECERRGYRVAYRDVATRIAASSHWDVS